MESSDVDQQLEELRGGLQHQWQAVWRLLEATERQLEETARQEEEADVGLEAQCASLRAELELTREQLAAAEASAEEYGRELTALKRSFDKLKSKVTALLAYSKKERQRISDMYRAQNAALRKENESFRREHADLSARFQEREERLQQMLKEKALVVTELSDLMNRFCSSDEVRALEVSCTETPLDTTRSLDEDPEEMVATTVARQASASCADCDARAAAAAASGDPASNISTTEWVLACMVLLMAVIVLGCWRGSFWMFRG